MRWFRMHTDILSNVKLKLVAFEDRWHFVAVCCMKAKGLLDDQRPENLRARMIAAHLGLTVTEADEVRRRLVEVDLIREDWQPKGWDKYQYASDNSTDRVRKFREKQGVNGAKRSRNVSVTPSDTDTDTESDTEEKKKTGARMARPTLEDVRQYCEERNNGVDPEAFMAHYESNGWRVGKNPMKSWKAAVITWEKRDAKSGNRGGSRRQSIAERNEQAIRELDQAARFGGY